MKGDKILMSIAVFIGKFKNTSTNQRHWSRFGVAKTNATLLENERNDNSYVLGYQVHAQLGFNFMIYKYFFTKTGLRAGYINIQEIRTTFDKFYKASQEFTFLQTALLVGGRFKLF